MVGEIGIEGFYEAAAAVLAAHETDARVEEVAVAVAALEEILAILGLSQFARGLGEGPVCDGILHVRSEGLVVQVGGDVAIFHPQVLAPVWGQGGGLHRLESLLIIESGNILCDGIRHRSDAGIADHAVGFVAVEMPDGEVSLTLVDLEEGFHEITFALRLDDRVQWHRSAICVPQGEDGVFRLGAVVAEEGWDNGCVIEGGVEDLSVLLVGCRNLDLAEFAVPFVTGLLAGRLEVPAG